MEWQKKATAIRSVPVAMVYRMSKREINSPTPMPASPELNKNSVLAAETCATENPVSLTIFSRKTDMA